MRFYVIDLIVIFSGFFRSLAKTTEVPCQEYPLMTRHRIGDVPYWKPPNGIAHRLAGEEA
jgi:hypothetical protein